MVIGSCCSGAGFFDLGFSQAGHKHAWFCEIDPFRRQLLRRHFPGKPVYEDLTALDPSDLADIDCLIGGTPCPDWSNAGRRKGFGGKHADLFWHFIRIKNALNPEWTVWENVPGVFSSHSGKDFALVLGALVGGTVDPPKRWTNAGVVVGPEGQAAWRVLDAQFFGVAQRRRRVFVVVDSRELRAASVLLVPESRHGDPAPSRETQPQTASTSTGSSGSAGVYAHSLGGEVSTALGAAGKGRGVDPTDLERGGGRVDIAGALDRKRGGVDDNDARANHIIFSHRA